MDKFTVELKQGSIAVGVIQEQGARDYQEDRFGFSPVKPGEQAEQFTAVVADGMGGLNAGAFVSEYTVKRLLEAEINPGTEVPEQLCAAVRRISGELAAGGSRGGAGGQRWRRCTVCRRGCISALSATAGYICGAAQF